ncbi:hypothetical protein M231_04521 [Tremella mesenterica]|uniref:Uncharacterized protein n=1 Tax=Tremella mesenterica TaxID=5217 RepID=A0A4V1M3W0_TREME|nr:uncharacterized protein TREMEDRAFT_65751 [Tremella mesenterica DSM 1558]EIW66154.1 hypothetical protein TREMEDRAFT_65751 [Tremella mesenterica DSM 1558]RXK38237.1 hypothetical protein M231_04521 [Tremella mesenterica]
MSYKVASFLLGTGEKDKTRKGARVVKLPSNGSRKPIDSNSTWGSAIKYGAHWGPPVSDGPESSKDLPAPEEEADGLTGSLEMEKHTTGLGWKSMAAVAAFTTLAAFANPIGANTVDIYGPLPQDGMASIQPSAQVFGKDFNGFGNNIQLFPNVPTVNLGNGNYPNTTEYPPTAAPLTETLSSLFEQAGHSWRNGVEGAHSNYESVRTVAQNGFNSFWEALPLSTRIKAARLAANVHERVDNMTITTEAVRPLQALHKQYGLTSVEINFSQQHPNNMAIVPTRPLTFEKQSDMCPLDEVATVLPETHSQDGTTCPNELRTFEKPLDVCPLVDEGATVPRREQSRNVTDIDSQRASELLTAAELEDTAPTIVPKKEVFNQQPMNISDFGDLDDEDDQDVTCFGCQQAWDTVRSMALNAKLQSAAETGWSHVTESGRYIGRQYYEKFPAVLHGFRQAHATACTIMSGVRDEILSVVPAVKAAAEAVQSGYQVTQTAAQSGYPVFQEATSGVTGEIDSTMRHLATASVVAAIALIRMGRQEYFSHTSETSQGLQTASTHRRGFHSLQHSTFEDTKPPPRHSGVRTPPSSSRQPSATSALSAGFDRRALILKMSGTLDDLV